MRYLGLVEATDRSLLIHEPKVRFGCRCDCEWTVSRHERLRCATLQLMHERTLPVWLKATLDLIDNSDWMHALVVSSDGKR